MSNTAAITALVCALIGAVANIVAAVIRSRPKPSPGETPVDDKKVSPNRWSRLVSWKTVGETILLLVLGGLAGYFIGRLVEERSLSAHKAGDMQTRSTDGIVMAYVPAGSFDMGSTNDGINGEIQLCDPDVYCERDSFEPEQPEHTVHLDAFWIDKTEVTNAQYRLCIESGKCSPPSENGSYTRDSYFDNRGYDHYPVIYVSWDQAMDYCEWVGGRLPTEAEWEYAARGPEGHVFPWGDDRPDNTLLNYSGNVGDTVRVGEYEDGASWCGALDVAGNVWEWVNDWYDGDYYRRSPPQNPMGPASGEAHGLRGGNWASNQHRVRTTQRDYYTEEWSPLYLVGFRCVIPEE